MYLFCIYVALYIDPNTKTTMYKYVFTAAAAYQFIFIKRQKRVKVKRSFI